MYMPMLILDYNNVMQSINGASLEEHWAAQHCLHGSTGQHSIVYMEAIVAQGSRVYRT